MHPFIKILLFILTLLISGVVPASLLSILTVFLMFIAILVHKDFLKQLSRMRWLFLSIFMVYTFGTSGELLPFFPLYFAPTYEGLWQGFLQLSRLLIALAALSLLMNTSTKEELISGMYWYLLPFRYLGLNVARFAARLILTLHYVELLSERGKQPLRFAALHEAFENVPNADISGVNLQLKHFSRTDKWLLVLIALLALLLMVWMSQ